MDFVVVMSVSPYNGIIGRSGIREIQAVPSTAHGMLKFPVDEGIATICSTILIPAECATVITSPAAVSKGVETHLENFRVAIHPNFPDQEVAIGGTLSLAGHTELCTLLKKLDIFAWKPSDMTGVARINKLNIANIRFISKSAEKSLPLFKTLKKCIKKSAFHWTPKTDQAFKHLKQHLSELPLLVAPKPREELIMYLSASFGAISAVLMTERGTVQTLVYFISHALQGPELNYSPMEKLVMSLVFAAKRLRRPCTSPSTAFRDWICWKPDENQPDAAVVETPSEPWTLFTDGNCGFAASNNEAEYEALIAGL
ncbi:reverse transcriptase domain-containing protein [Tanacetum coccineum]